MKTEAVGLRGKQQDVADEALKVLQRENFYSDHGVYISGEMGVGKTFMGSYIISQMVSKRGVLLCVPRTVINKWEQVLQDYCSSEVTIYPYGTSDIKEDLPLKVLPNEITIMDEELFNRAFKPALVYGDGTDADTGRKELLSATPTKALLSYLKHAPLVVLDEVHTFSGVRIGRYETMRELVTILRKQQTISHSNYLPDGSLKYKYLPLWERNLFNMAEYKLVEDKDTGAQTAKALDYTLGDSEWLVKASAKSKRVGPFKVFRHPDNCIVTPNYTADNLLRYEGLTADQTVADTYFPALYLTGTVFNTDLAKLWGLLSTTHPNLLNSAVSKLSGEAHPLKVEPPIGFNTKQSKRTIFKEHYGHNIFNFTSSIWQYISISISLDDVDGLISKDTDNEVHQTVAPIKMLRVTDEQRALYDLIGKQLLSLGVTYKKAYRMASTFLDNPEKKLEYRIGKGRTSRLVGTHYTSFVGLPLLNLNFKETAKYQRLLDILTDEQDSTNSKRTLLYVNETDLIGTIATALAEDGYQVDRLPKGLDQKEYARYINESYEKGTKVFVVNPSDISVGVDIEADTLIWYQLMADIASMIQAQRRVYRLSSKRDSVVYFLAYELTYQDELVKEVSNSTKNNAATYGVQQKDRLAQLTGVLLDGIDK